MNDKQVFSNSIMDESGDAATKQISCEPSLVNATQVMLAKCGDFPVSSVRRIQVLSKLDTGCKHLALLPQQIKDLELQPVDEIIPVKSAVN